MTFPVAAIEDGVIFFSIIPSPVHLISCRAVMSVLYESNCDKSFFRAPAWYNDNTFHVPVLQSFNPLHCLPRQISPVLTSLDFVTIIFESGWGCQAHAQPPAILEDRCFSVGVVSLSRPALIKASGTRFAPLYVLAV